MTPHGVSEDRGSAPQARVGESLTEHWVLYAFLGDGPMSTVYAATHPEAEDERVAIKVFDRRIGQDPLARAAFVAEATAPNAISHSARAIVVGDGMSDRGELFIVSELLAGASLDQYMRMGVVVASVPKKLALFDSVLGLLADCHAAGIVHRDIKPTNLQLTRSGQLTLLDFGTARLRELEAESDPANAPLLNSTSAFMAPEQALGLSDLVDHRADLWSVGACMYTLLTGQEVHQASGAGGSRDPLALAATAKAVSIAHALPDLPPDVVAFIDKALAYDRAHRFQDAAAMRAALGALGDRPSTNELSVPKGSQPLASLWPRSEPPSRLPSGPSSPPLTSSQPARAVPHESGVLDRVATSETAAGLDASERREPSRPDEGERTSQPVPRELRRSSASEIAGPRRSKTFDPRAEPITPLPRSIPASVNLNANTSGSASKPPDDPPFEDTSESPMYGAGGLEETGERDVSGEQRRPSTIVDAIRATSNPHEQKTLPPPPPETTPSVGGSPLERASEIEAGGMTWNDVPRLADTADSSGTWPLEGALDDSSVDVLITTDDAGDAGDEEPEPESPPASDVRALLASVATGPVAVGRYVILDRIASGGMASVHIGRFLGPVGFARTVAIKRMHPHFLGDPEFVSMFLDEARVAMHVRHPNVVPTLDVVATPQELFLVLEYARGVTLSSLLRMAEQQGVPMPLPIALAILSSVLHGLEAAHGATGPRGEPLGLVHRDISPQNVLIGPDGLARILDFGVAKASGRAQHTGAGTLKGKIPYMAPEQIRGGSVTRRADIYAASVVLWEAVTGRRLFYGANEASTLEQVLWGDVPTPSSARPELPAALDTLVMRGLSRDPVERFESAEEMATLLEEALPVAITPVVGRWVRMVAKDTLLAQSARLAKVESLADEAAPAPARLAGS